MSNRNNRTTRAAAPAAAAAAAPAAAAAETPAAAAPAAAETPAAQTDANHDGHDDTTGQFVDGNAGRPAEQHPAPAVTETSATDEAADDTAEAEETDALAPRADGEIPVVVSLMKIDGHPAGRIFKPTDAEQLADLTRLAAIRPATEDEAAIYAATAPAAEASDFE